MSKIEELSFAIKGLTPESKKSLMDAMALQAAHCVSHYKPLPDYTTIENLKELINGSDIFLVDDSGNLIGQKSDDDKLKGFAAKVD